MAQSTKKEREKMYTEASKKKFVVQKQALLKPNLIIFAINTLLFIILMIMDTPKVIFDESSMLFSILLLINTVMPLISFIIVYFSLNTTHLLVTLSLNQLCIIPLIIIYFIKYDEMKNCSSYHMLIICFFYLISYLVMTSMMFNIKSKHLSTLAEK